MPTYRYRLLNVFAVPGDALSGNALCVFEEGTGLDAATMQTLARQFNLSETTFILPSAVATARVRIFTPTFEMPFAGHPTLGTAHVVRALARVGDALTLETQAGIIPVTAAGNRWTLQANPPRTRPVAATRVELAEMLGVAPAEVGEPPLWVNTGSEQLVIPLDSAEAVARCRPVPALLERHGRLHPGRYLAYVWAHASAGDIRARFFFPVGTAVTEDPATGSACANLGGWFIATGAALPLSRRIHQGEAVGRPSVLELHVDAEKHIYVSGEVIELGDGVVRL